ncbi:hypothetical protein MP638_003786 [Amoeboaphelidium occidentale]|nr:hypothetical protein MP638_003786 [Amoeboaphelidium occidentale]
MSLAVAMPTKMQLEPYKEDEIFLSESAKNIILENLKLLEEASNTRIRYDDDQNCLRILGPSSGLSYVRVAVQQVLYKKEDEAVEFQILPVALLGAFIGTNGCELQELEIWSGAKCTVESRCSLFGLLYIRGSFEARLKAKILLGDRLKYSLEDTRTERIRIPSSAVSKLIGKGGCTIKRINAQSGAVCEIDEETTAAFVNIKGNGKERQKARFLIEQELRQLLENHMANGPQVSHLIFSRPFPSKAVIDISYFKKIDAHLLGVIADLDDTRTEEEVQKSSSGNFLNCISFNWMTSTMAFCRKPQMELLSELLGTITKFAELASERRFSGLRVELSFGKQAFRLERGSHLPSQFQLPDACLRPYSKFMSDVFSGSRFHDKLSGDVMRNTESFLKEEGYEKRSKHSQIPIDVYWKDLETKDKVMTKIHADKNGDVAVVGVLSKKFKPIVVTFMHPNNMFDFRIRVTAKYECNANEVPEKIMSICDSMRVKVEAGQVNLDYPVMCNVTDSCFRVKQKSHYYKESIKASLQRVYQSHTYIDEPAHLKAQDEHISQKTKTVVSHELSLKNKKLNKLLESFMFGYETSRSGKLREVSSAKSTDNASSYSGSTKSHFTHERSLKNDIAFELQNLLRAGDKICSGVDFQL